MAMIHGGIPYVYPSSDSEYIKLANIAMELHQKVAYSEMVRHTYLDEQRTIHQSVFSNGITVLVNVHTGCYEIMDTFNEN
jgi:hypothetical protein